MRKLTLPLSIALMSLSANAFAGGMMKGGGPSLAYIVFILGLIFIGIPCVVGLIVAYLSKTKKKQNFLLGALITILAIGIFILINMMVHS